MSRSLQWRIALVAVVLAGCIFLLYPTVGPVPALWAKYLPNNPIRLGLDLQGGLNLTLEVQAEKAVEAEVDQAIEEATAAMKLEKVRYSDAQRTSPTAMMIALKDPAQETLFDSTVLDKLPSFKKTSAGPGEKGYEIHLEMDPKAVEATKQRAVRQDVDTIRNRVDEMGVAEPDVAMQGKDRIIVQLPGLKEDVDQAIEKIKRTGRLEFKLVDDQGDLEAARRGDVPPGDEILYKVHRDRTSGVTSRSPILIKKQSLMSGDTITDARVQPDQFGRMSISITFNAKGATQFERLTGDHVRERLAIILDNVVYSDPVIKDRIPGGHCQIEGDFTPDEASDLARVLRKSLPAPVRILENRTVGPSLGEDSIRMGRDAILVGICLIAIGMVVYYRMAGVVADIALILNPILLFAVMVSPGLRATLTLPGLAGVALTMGMAIDANILIFERVREELRMGKSARAAMENGYDKAWITILDTHLTCILSSLPLIQFGTGPVKGFAVTLCIGLLISLFTAFFVTRTIFDYAFQVRRIKSISI